MSLSHDEQARVLAHLHFARTFIRYAYDHRLIAGEEYVRLVRGINISEKEFYACKSKERFATRKAADDAIQRQHRTSKLEVYQCWACSGFHLAARTTIKRRRRLDQQQREMAGA